MKPLKIVTIQNHPNNEGEQWAAIQLPRTEDGKVKPAIDVSTVEYEGFTREEFTKVVTLFASAPELLEALQTLLYQVEGLDDTSDMENPSVTWQSDPLQEAIEQAKNLISKATGN